MTTTPLGRTESLIYKTLGESKGLHNADREDGHQV